MDWLEFQMHPQEDGRFMSQRMQRPAGVSAIAVLFFAVAAYLAGLGILMLVSPGIAPMALGAPLLNGLELAGAYMFLLGAGVCALIAWGLLRLNPWARRAAIVAAFVGVIMLVPAASSAVFEFRMGRLFLTGVGVIVRVMIVWYLWQMPVAECFSTKLADS
jgi:hypothetical protein